METVNQFVHAYKQAPWRLQRQWISVFLLSLLGFAMIATLYLMVTSKAAILGREIQGLRANINANERVNADLQTALAALTSKSAMEVRASAMGFRTVRPTEREYLVVPGYVAQKGAVLASAPEMQPSAPSMQLVYTQSLLDWLDEQVRTPRGLR